jgi:hypothetical protein
MPLAAIRPDDWNFPLLLHVVGATLLVGTLIVALTALLLAWRRDDAGAILALNRFGFRALLIGVVPAYILMRVGAEWIQSKEFGDAGEDPDWVGVGYVTADLGVPVLVVALILAGLAVRRARRPGAGVGLARAAGVLTAVLVVAYLIAMWAMTAKPGD